MGFFNRIGIKKQMYILLAALMCSCIFLGLLFNNTIKNLLLQNYMDYSYSTMEKLNIEMNHLRDRVNSIFQLLQYDNAIEVFFSEPSSTSALVFETYFSPVLGSNTDLRDIALVNDQVQWSKLYSNSKLKELVDSIPVTEVKPLGILKGEASNKEVVSFAFGKKTYRLLNSQGLNQPLGNIILSVNPCKTSSTLHDTQKEPSFFYLYTPNHDLFSLNNIPELDLKSKEIEALVQKHFHSFSLNPQEIITINTQNYILTLSYSDSMQNYFISAVSKESYYKNLNHTSTLILTIWITVTVFVMLMMWVILHNIVEPTNQLCGFIHTIRSGDRRKLASSITLNGSKDVHKLGSEFSDLLTELNDLNTQLFKTTTHLYELELEKQSAEINHLRSQINPHFLYNTLETLKGIALEHQVPVIASICTDMGKMFRYSIKGSATVPLHQELSIIKAYLEIQLVRFEGRFQVLYSISEDTLDLLMMKMLLQPIIENAIIHGLEHQQTLGTLYIGSKLQDGFLTITVQDDGCGMEKKTLDSLNNALAHCNDEKINASHIGLTNVHQRIALYYGTDYGLTIDSILDEGTVVTIKLPVNHN